MLHKNYYTFIKEINSVPIEKNQKNHVNIIITMVIILIMEGFIRKNRN